MSLGRIVVNLLKGKVIAVIGVGAVLAGGATAAMAATPTGQHFIQTVTAQAANLSSHDLSTNRPNGAFTPSSHKDDSSHQDATPTAKACPGPDVQILATMFSLNTGSNSDDIQAICALRNGTFTGTTPNGQTVTSSRVFGDGEIYILLRYAQYLASHDKSNTAGKLTNENTRNYLAAGLQSCGTSSFEACVKQVVPSSWLDKIPDNIKDSIQNKIPNGNGIPNWNSTNGGGSSSDNKNNGGKSTNMLSLNH